MSDLTPYTGKLVSDNYSQNRVKFIYFMRVRSHSTYTWKSRRSRESVPSCLRCHDLQRVCPPVFFAHAASRKELRFFEILLRVYRAFHFVMERLNLDLYLLLSEVCNRDVTLGRWLCTLKKEFHRRLKPILRLNKGHVTIPVTVLFRITSPPRSLGLYMIRKGTYDYKL